MNRIVFAAAFLLLDLGAASAAEKGPSVAHGRMLFLTSGCKHCHGTLGHGTNSGARLAPNPMPAEAIAQYIRAPRARMPAYSATVLSDADVADIHAYLATMSQPKSPDAIPALKDLKP